MLPAEMVNSRLETGEAAGEWGERECRLWVTLKAECWGALISWIFIPSSHIPCSHSRKGGEPCSPQRLQQQVELQKRGLESVQG